MKSKIYLLIGLMLCVRWLEAQPADVRLKQFNIEKTGLALQGYDPVAYFVNHKAMKGKNEITTLYEGVVYRFSSDKNKTIFLMNPLNYEPQYGGWCAFAMGAKGEKVEVNPETFKISNGKLFLFYNQFFNNTLKDWNKDEPSLKTNADRNWKKMITLTK
ncbi:MAG: YHS domain protein [Bacteroidetes bacterium]|nr:YHS domain protein [Bacteroidota bacterium]